MRWHPWQKAEDPWDPFDGLDEILKAQGHTGRRFTIVLFAIAAVCATIAILMHRSFAADPLPKPALWARKVFSTLDFGLWTLDYSPR
jgi:hypothetical protein